MLKESAVDLSYSLLNDYNLYNWNVIVSNRPKRRLGQCRYNTREIILSSWIFTHCPEQVEDTVRHEVAHAVVGPGKGHKDVWKRMAVELGASPKACVQLNPDQMLPKKWCTKCSSCNDITKMSYRRRSERVLNRRCCRKCKGKLTQVYVGKETPIISQQNESRSKTKTFNWETVCVSVDCGVITSKNINKRSDKVLGKRVCRNCGSKVFQRPYTKS